MKDPRSGGKAWAMITQPMTVVKLTLSDHRFTFTTEAELQDAIAEALSFLPIEREYRLSQEDRPDFFLCGLAVEVKIAGGLSRLVRQIHRYSTYEEVKSILVLTNRSSLTHIPCLLSGKPVSALRLKTGL